MRHRSAFGPGVDPVLERFSAEGIVLAGGGAALLLQLANPAVGIGVARHSSFATEPIRRLLGTLEFLTAQVFGDDADRAAAAAFVDAAHDRVRGSESSVGGAYSAHDPELQRWVAATLYVSALRVHARAFGPLEADTAAHLLRGFARVGTALRMPADAWPPDPASFGAYWTDAVRELRVLPEAAEVGRSLFAGVGLPAALSPALGLLRLVSLDLLPPRVRRGYTDRWGRLDRFAVELWWALAVPVYRVLPSAVRQLPVRLLLRRIRSRRPSTRSG